MTKLLESFGERMLNTLAPRVTAGACVPDHGALCSCDVNYNVRLYCDTGARQWAHPKYKVIVGCNGACTSTTTQCGVVLDGACSG